MPVTRTQEDSTPASSVCLSPACVLAAAGILQNMSPDSKVDPCQDFYKYVCEGWEAKHDLRADQESVSSASIMYETSQQTLRQVLESPYSGAQFRITSSPSADRAIFEKLQTAYNACIDESTIRSLGSFPLLEILREIGALFPVKSNNQRPDSSPSLVDQDQNDVFLGGANQLTKTLAFLSSIGVDALVGFNIGVGLRNFDIG